MTLAERIGLAARIVWWRLTWKRRNLDFRPAGALDPRFMTAREAAALVPDGSCGLSTGMAGNARCSTLLWALRERFEATGHPRGLTWIAVGGQGGRGRAPGTVEEIGLDGLVTRFISGHVETTKSMLKLAEAGKLELHVLPQGEMCFALAAQPEGREVGHELARWRPAKANQPLGSFTRTGSAGPRGQLHERRIGAMDQVVGPAGRRGRRHLGCDHVRAGAGLRVRAGLRVSAGIRRFGRRRGGRDRVRRAGLPVGRRHGPALRAAVRVGHLAADQRERDREHHDEQQDEPRRRTAHPASAWSPIRPRSRAHGLRNARRRSFERGRPR